MILPLFFIFLCLMGMLFLVFGDKLLGTKKVSDKERVSAQDFINTKDIENHVLYTMDGYCISYVKITPPMSSLWSRTERRIKTDSLVADFSKDNEEWMMTAVSRPMDITQLINHYRQLRDDTTNRVRRNILKQEMEDLQRKVGDGEAVERQFYMKIWTTEKEGAELELKERAMHIVSNFSASGIEAMLITKPDIIRFCNLVHNASYVNVDDVNDTLGMPVIYDVEV